ncbi:hypothetical protein RZS08_63825, partial [Arthrospira platensis SPKY1]|nr:hypothetical protein [Arthrospira platensis SPKY1]
ISKGDPKIVAIFERLKGHEARIVSPKSPEKRYEEDMRSLGVWPNPTKERAVHSDHPLAKPTPSKKSRPSMIQAWRNLIHSPKSFLGVVLATLMLSLCLVILYLQS